MINREHTIWQNTAAEIDAILEDMNANREAGEPEYTFCDAAEVCDSYLEDEKCNLSGIKTNEIVCLAEIGRWNGTVSGWKELKSIDACFDCVTEDCDTVCFFCDKEDFRAVGYHHDGYNRYLFRERRDGITAEQWELFVDKLYNFKLCDATIEKYTQSISPKIAAVYGWIS